ncbi:MAG TPA: CRTAC1 family protein [Kofleriaceae bacterium]|nr:CRTAC1 family protein [Kofleriaceae bacterium]
MRGSLGGLVFGVCIACGGSGSGDPGGPGGPADGTPPLAGGRDPNPKLTFTQVGRSVGIDRSREPASAGSFAADGTLAYGAWLADLDGDGRLDYYAVNHAQLPHLSGLFVNTGKGGFGENLFSVALQPSPDDFPHMDLSNEMKYVGDLTGDGLVDFYFTGWSGFGVMCVNQGVVSGADWSGPGYTCYGTTDALDVADVNGDGRPDVLGLDLSSFDTYTTYYSHTGKYVWRLNTGDPDINHWTEVPAERFHELHPAHAFSASPPFVDLDGDGIADKIVGIERPDGDRGGNDTLTAGKQVFLGQSNGTYVQKAAGDLDKSTDPIRMIEDVNGDGCLDVGTDETAYRDNQSWYIQHKTGATCDATFTLTPRTQLPYYPGTKRYDVDIDNSGLMSKVVLIHAGYGNNDGQPVGVSIYRKLSDGTYQVIRPEQSGIQITGTDDSEFYADNLSPGDWNDDGAIDFAGTGTESIAGSDSGHALWTSGLVTTNGWIKVTPPTVTGPFTGAAVIEVFTPGSVGDATRLVAEPRRLYTGEAWASQVYHIGIGTSSSVDVRVTFPDGHQVVHTGVGRNQRIAIQ